jgi:hypothetical protein
MYDLNTLLVANTGNWVISNVVGINDKGQIIADGIVGPAPPPANPVDGESYPITHALLLTPTSAPRPGVIP